MNKSILSIIGIAILMAVILSGCVSNNSYTPPATTDNTVTAPGDNMQKTASPDEVATNVSGTSGVSDAELNELDAIAQDLDASATEIQESNI